ncbi:hypothetical protein M8C21_019884, partial [Ambrosia artemisiifolia]
IPDDADPPSFFSTTHDAPHHSHSGDNNKKRINDRSGFDWDLINFSTDNNNNNNNRMQPNRQSPFPPSIGGLQRQSSGSSYAESSISGDYFLPSLSAADGGEVMRLKLSAEAGGGGGGGSYSSKSWAQQTEESYQLQLALALRLSTEAMFGDDPNLLDTVTEETTAGVSRSSGSSVTSAEALSHRFWANGCLSYFDKVPDGFYLIYGMDPYVWTMCCDLQESGRIPSLEMLKAIDTRSELLIEVILIDRRSDPSLRELQNRIHSISCNSITPLEVVDQLAKLVCHRMGELHVDLIGNPGSLSEPDSLLNGPSTISISSPLRFPRFRQVEPLVDFRSLAKQYFAESDSLNLVFESPSSGEGDTGDVIYSNKQSDKNHVDKNIVARSPSNSNEGSRLPPSKAVRPKGHDRNLQHPKAYAQNMMGTTKMIKDSQSHALSNTRMEVAGYQRFGGGQPNKASEDFTLDFEDLDIPWSDLDLKEKIGAVF